MNRERKFRGKRIDNDEWVYGDLIQYGENEYKILEPFLRQWDILEGGYDVVPESIGEYTGQKDKKEKDIYEGDIDKSGNVIMYSKEKSLFCPHYYSEHFEEWYTSSYPMSSEWMEIIGNIQDNKDLIK